MSGSLPIRRKSSLVGVADPTDHGRERSWCRGYTHVVVATNDLRPADSSTVLERARGLLGSSVFDDSALRRWLRALPSVDEVGADAQARAATALSVRGRSEELALELAISMVDLTTLEGCDTPSAVRSLCAKARFPGHPDDPDSNEVPCPPVAAVCVYHDMVPTAVRALAGSQVKIASVSAAFPSGRAALHVKLADVECAVNAGADEIDMVIDRGALLSGRYAQVFEEILAVRAVCDRGAADGERKGAVHLKVILETGELGSYDDIRRAAWLSMLAGADFVKTSTGKISPAATPSSTLLLCQAVRDWHALTGQVIGVKPAGGIRTAKQAIGYLVLVREILGDAWLTPDRFRFGASGLLDDILLRRKRIGPGPHIPERHVPSTT